MQKRASRRSMNSGRKNEEQQTNKVEKQGDSISQKDCNTDSLIADMAQGFIQAQANTVNNASKLSNKDVISLLEKVNNQLEEIKGSTKEKQNVGNQAQGGQSSNKKSTQQEEVEQSTSGSSSKEKTDQELLKQLKELVGATLQEKGKNENSINTSSKSQNDSSENSDTKNQQQSNMPAQMASQVLAQAQYELANELENSLEKLKQVIKKSEKVATNISNLLGEENKNKS
ncbi:hypothetical protein [Pelosinus sp. UFO1]|uniref:hypothetical protein n=1 Tax=Pelosinus sp. UFO1 TaxID=484770 RepID=UPI0004D1E11F|nr:hypothetical protein [Pelosinus sp. UFO1]AIF51529.1 hypothetical protein UFO1_1982 [Pelosinus sp. UFO1]